MFLVDGNNLMALSAGWQRDKGAARRRLLEELARFAKRARVKVSVAFDGAPEEFFADGSSYGGVQVFYARGRGRGGVERLSDAEKSDVGGSDADARIKEIVEASRERRTLYVVTSDRALAEYVRRCGAQTISSRDFRRRMNEQGTTSDDGSSGRHSKTIADRSHHPTPSEERRGSVRPAEVGDWLRYFGMEENDEG